MCLDMSVCGHLQKGAEKIVMCGCLLHVCKLEECTNIYEKKSAPFRKCALTNSLLISNFLSMQYRSPCCL